MALRKIPYSSGRTDFLDERGRVKYSLDKDGHPQAPETFLTPAERDEHDDLVARASYKQAMSKARGAPLDPRFPDARDYIMETLTPQEQAIVNEDPTAFNQVFGRARNIVGESAAEIEAREKRSERISELEQKLSESGEGRHGRGVDLGDLAELMQLKKEEGT